MEYLYRGLACLVGSIICGQLAWKLDFGLVSAWELYKNRLASTNPKRQLQYRRWQAYATLKSINWLIIIINSGILLYLIQHAQDSFWLGLISWCIILVIIWLLAKTDLMKNFSAKIYQRFEKRLLDLAVHLDWLKLAVFEEIELKPVGLSSHQEFDFLVKNGRRVLSSAEQEIIQASRDFLNRKAQDEMVKLDQLVSVNASDLLGLIEINELYETGEKLFVVKTKKTIVGLISLDDLTNLSTGQTYKARQLARRDYLEVEATDGLVEVVSQMLDHDTQVALVADSHQILGIIELKTILKRLKLVKL